MAAILLSIRDELAQLQEISNALYGCSQEDGGRVTAEEAFDLLSTVTAQIEALDEWVRRVRSYSATLAVI